MKHKVTHVSDGFEVSKEVLEQRNSNSGAQHMIDEQTLTDLEYIDVAHSPYRFLKRAFDIVGAVFGLLILFIPLCLVALLIFIDDPGLVFFRQYRVGLQGKRFRLYKFRSMKIDTPKYMSTMDVDDPDRYITRIGKWLRKFSIDELPQLVNVLLGDMSFVGPRPLISDEYEIHRLRMKYGVYSTRPGITGLAQIHGRDMVEPADKVRWDAIYLHKFGLWTDLKILLITIPVMLGGSGVAEGYNSNKKSA